MAVCENCGNDYDKAFEVTMDGKSHTFDSFECAINMLAPACAHCGTRSSVTASKPAAASTAATIAPRRAGVEGLRDRV